MKTMHPLTPVLVLGCDSELVLLTHNLHSYSDRSAYTAFIPHPRVHRSQLHVGIVESMSSHTSKGCWFWLVWLTKYRFVLDNPANGTKCFCRSDPVSIWILLPLTLFCLGVILGIAWPKMIVIGLKKYSIVLHCSSAGTALKRSVEIRSWSACNPTGNQRPCWI